MRSFCVSVSCIVVSCDAAILSVPIGFRRSCATPATKANSFVFAPGTYEILWIGETWKSKAETALGRAKKACDFERDSKEGDAGDEGPETHAIRQRPVCTRR